MSHRRRVSLAAALVVFAGAGYLTTPTLSASTLEGCTEAQIAQIVAFAERRCGGDGWTAYAECPNSGTLIITAVDCG